MSGHRATREGLDDNHATAAVWAGVRVVIIGGVGGLGLGRGDGEQLAGARDVVGAGRLGQQAVVADAVKAARQHMDQKPADELVGCECHLLVSITAFDPVVLPFEGDAVLVECDQAAERYRPWVASANFMSTESTTACDFVTSKETPTTNPASFFESVSSSAWWSSRWEALMQPAHSESLLEE
jgi:hypothetical protein